jgi:hypothetical protein
VLGNKFQSKLLEVIDARYSVSERNQLKIPDCFANIENKIPKIEPSFIFNCEQSASGFSWRGLSLPK